MRRVNDSELNLLEILPLLPEVFLAHYIQNESTAKYDSYVLKPECIRVSTVLTEYYKNLARPKDRTGRK